MLYWANATVVLNFNESKNVYLEFSKKFFILQILSLIDYSSVNLQVGFNGNLFHFCSIFEDVRLS